MSGQQQFSSTPIVYVVTETHYRQQHCSSLLHGTHDFTRAPYTEADSIDVEIIGVFSGVAVAQQCARSRSLYNLEWGTDAAANDNDGVVWLGWARPPNAENHWCYVIEPWHLDSLPALAAEFPAEGV